MGKMTFSSLSTPLLILSTLSCCCYCMSRSPEPDYRNTPPLTQLQPSLSPDYYEEASSLKSSPSPGRKSKLFPYFLIQFPNEYCTSTAGSGVCVSQKECRNQGGTTVGVCAQGFGACCKYTRSCGKNGEDVQVKENSTEITGAEGTSESDCRFVLPKGRNICQVRLDFVEFNYGEGLPSGECSDAKLVLSGKGIGDDGRPVSLCGNLTGQHLYFNYGEADKLYIEQGKQPIGSEKYTIQISYLRCNSKQSVPPHCTQMMTGSQGEIRSLNWPHQQLNNQEYTVCISPSSPTSSGALLGRGKRSRNSGKYQFPSSTLRALPGIRWSTCGTGMDDFSISGNRTDPPVTNPSSCNTDYIQIFGGNRQCGNKFQEETIFTTPHLLRVRFDSNEILGRLVEHTMHVTKPDEGCEALNTNETICTDVVEAILQKPKPNGNDEGQARSKVCRCIRATGLAKKRSKADVGNKGFCLRYTVLSD